MSGPANIFAELTPPGRGGISTLALMGPRIATALAAVFRSARDESPEAGRIVYGRIVDAAGQTVDEVIVHGAGGCGDSAELEIHCHGGPAAVRAVASRLGQAGLARVEWPQYLAARAARLGTSQVILESELMLPQVSTLPAAMVILNQRNGLLAEAVAGIRRLMDDDGKTAEAVALLDRLIAAYEAIGRRIECPPRVAILGPANVGKSSLMNTLVGRERAIVTDVPGTTRDVVTEAADLDGLPVVVADTAGIRPGGDAVEQLGVERARAEAFRADLLLYLVDLSRPLLAEEESLPADLPPGGIVIGTKADLRSGVGPSVTIDVATSAVTGQGVQELAGLILARLGFRWPEDGEAVPFTGRQAAALRRARDALVSGDSRRADDELSTVAAPAAGA